MSTTRTRAARQRARSRDGRAPARAVAALTRALDTLPIEQRIAFVLCEVEERSSPDAAEIVGVPEGTLRTRLFHAKRKLREQLAREGFQ